MILLIVLQPNIQQGVFRLPSKYSAHSAYNLGMTFINRGQIALLESRFHFQIEYCNVPTVALFQIRNADWFIIDIWQMFTCK